MNRSPTPIVFMKPQPQPLTHHEILRWVEPFTRRGRQVDLAASDRMARRLAFKPLAHDAVTTGAQATPAFIETLQVESIDAGRYRLRRILASHDGPVAELETTGTQLGELLARVEAVPPARQLGAGPGFVVAQSHRLDAIETAAPRLVLTRGVARIAELGLTLTLVPPTVRGMLADLSLAAPAGDTLTLPDDLLAVLGRDWSRLAEVGEGGAGWRSSLHVRGGELRRSRDAEAKLAQVATHLAACLAEAPARFHERHRAARRWVYARRAVPLLTCIGLVAAAASVPRLGLPDNSPWRMLIFNAPPLLLILVFCLRELPRIELPPWPRALSATTWHTPTRR